MPGPTSTPLTIETLLRVIAERDAEVMRLTLMVDKLRLQLARRAREQYGRSSEQLTLIVAEPPQPVVPVATPPESDKRRRSERKPRELPAHLPRETQVHHPRGYTAEAPCACSECGGKLRQIGQDVAEQLEYVPGRFKVIRHVRPKLACVRCEGIFQASAPSRPITRGLPGPALLAHVMVAKYCDHTPLYRQSRIYARDGVDIERSTMAGWVGQGDELLDPLAAALGRYTLAGAKVHADDTPVPVLDPGRGRTKTGRLWVYVRDDRPCASRDAPAVWFQYSPDRSGAHPREHLKRYRGILQADAYSGYSKLFDSGRVVHAACMAHARRYYWEVYETQKRAAGSVAEQALKRIAKLYEIEADIRGRPPDERRRERLERAAPLLQGLHAWLSDTLTHVSAKSDLAQAIGYTLTHWQALTRYCEDGRIEIDNNAAERALRGVGLGRKNYLFFGSDAGGERGAAIYSLVETAKLNGLDPESYLRDVLERIAEHPINRIEDAAAVEHRRAPGSTTQGCLMATTVRKLAKRASATLQLHIELRGTKPKVWRRVLVPETIPLAKLHTVIQAAFGWSGGHLHEFSVGEERFGTPDPEYDAYGEVRSERTTRLTNALGGARTMDYVYDFGDNWRHRIKVEKKLEPMPAGMLPLCVAGANATPPDDCGGVYGYYDFVAAVSDPSHPEHAEMTEWIGRPWDAAEFDLERVNSWLREFKL